MSKQIRIDDNAYEDLLWMSAQTREKPTDFNSSLVKMFRQLVERVASDGRIYVEDAEAQRMEVPLPFRIRQAE